MFSIVLFFSSGVWYWLRLRGVLQRPREKEREKERAWVYVRVWHWRFCLRGKKSMDFIAISSYLMAYNQALLCFCFISLSVPSVLCRSAKKVMNTQLYLHSFTMTFTFLSRKPVNFNSLASPPSRPDNHHSVCCSQCASMQKNLGSNFSPVFSVFTRNITKSATGW